MTATPRTTRPTRNPLLFLVIFAAIYGLMYGAYFAVPDRILVNEVYEPVIVAPAATVLNVIAPEENVSFKNNRLSSSRAVLDVVRGCDGIGLLLLLTAAMLAFPSPLRLKALGIATGLLLMYVLNLVRIIILYFIVAYHGDWFIPLHTLFIPGALVLVGGLYFHLWTNLAENANHGDA